MENVDVEQGSLEQHHQSAQRRTVILFFHLYSRPLDAST